MKMNEIDEEILTEEYAEQIAKEIIEKIEQGYKLTDDGVFVILQ